MAEGCSRRIRRFLFPIAVLAALASAGLAPPIAAQVTLSEIRIDQPGTDVDEYFELEGPVGMPLAGLTYLVIGDGFMGSGVIEAVVDLTGSSIGGSGFFVAAESTFTLGTADLTTSLNFENSDNVTHLLVRDFSGINGADLDTDDDGILDFTPWSEMLDCVALIETVGSGDLVYCDTTVGPDGSFVPGHVSLCPGVGWQIGAFDPAVGTDTPGRINLCRFAGDPLINEFVANHTGSDTHEFVEVKGDPSTSYSAFTLLEIEGDGAGAGIIDGVFPVGTTNADGYWTTGFLSNALENGTLTLLLVEGFTGSVGDDLDANNDGVLDTMPWSRLVDAVGVSDGGAGDRNYASTVLAPGFDGIPFTPGGASRIPDAVDTDSVGDWTRNDFDGAGLPGFAGTPDLGEALNTPGARNRLVPPSLVINEIDYDQPGADTAEFIEIYNPGPGSVDLSGVTLELINGSGGGAAVYWTMPLPAVSLGPGGYFVVCGDAAAVINCDLDVTPASNWIHNGAPDAVALRFGADLLDAVSYEGDTGAPYTEGSGVGLEDSGAAGEDFKGISRFPNGIDTGMNNLDLRSSCITPGRANTSVRANCTALGPALEIFEIQGAGLASPFVGQGIATFDNIVTAVGLDGFFIQTPDARDDGDRGTSNGIFVFTGSPPAVAVGDQVDVAGEVMEFFGSTEISRTPTVIRDSAGNSLPQIVVFDATTPSPDPTTPSCGPVGNAAERNFECFEGMRVQIVGGRVTGPNQSFGTDPIAEVHVTAGPNRAFREPGVLFPGLGGAIPTWDGNPEVFELDPDKLGLSNAHIPAGSTFGAEGVIGFEFGGYELWPSAFTFAPAPLPVPARTRQPGEMAVGSLNLFRLFDDVDDPPDTNPAGQTRNDTVVSTAEYARRLDKLARHVVEVLRAPEILAVQEAEKLEVLQDLAAAIAALDASVVYAPHLIEGNDVGTIDIGFLTRDTVAVDSLTQLGRLETLTSDGSLLHDRPPLLLEARYTGNGADFPLAVMGVHNRSLGGIDDPVDGARVRQKRLEQAESIATKVQTFQTDNPTVPLAVIGDFNAFEFTDGYVDAVGHIAGSFDPATELVCMTNACPDLVDPDLANPLLALAADERYSFIFRGSAQTLDHALTSAAAGIWVRGLEFGRGNADAPLGDIETSGNPLRASDHDGLVLFLMTDADGDGVPDDLDDCMGTFCDDGNACTTDDRCDGAVCVGGPPPDCDDGNVCTDDSCDPTTGCVRTNNTAACDDGDACTRTDTCQAGACVGSDRVVCVPLNDCHDAGTCNPGSGICSNPRKPDETPCNDGNACTTADRCAAGTCVGGPPPTCNDGNVCTDDSCNPATGCVFTNNTAPCNDGNPCTLGDRCGGGTCQGSRDTQPPSINITQPGYDQTGLPSLDIPINVVFTATDNVRVAHELVKLENCTLRDGNLHGDRDGLLSDERIQINRAEICQAMARCGQTILYFPRIVVEARDACGNTGRASRIIRRNLIRSEVCRF